MPELGFDVVELPEADHVDEGDTAPDFTRPLVGTEYWEDTALSDAVDDRAVLCFTTMDAAFPATYLWNEIDSRDWTDDVDVYGLSISTPYAHEELLRRRADGVRLWSDPQNGVAEQWGLAHELDGMAAVAEPRPAVYVLEDDLAVEYCWVAEEWPDFPPYGEIEEHL